VQQTLRRLPGIRFESQAPPSQEVLPRMDVAGFVGFAASGPLHVPVPVEDPAQFAEIFGPDAPLAWDGRHGEQGFAYLGPTVRTFFRNGGSRCWVVRVAEAERASRDLFPLPGVAQLDAQGKLCEALLDARSPGSWADDLRVSSWLTPTPLRLLPVAPDALSYEARVASADEVVAGDLIQISFPDSPWELLFTVAWVKPVEPAATALVDGAQLLRLSVQGRTARWRRIADLPPLAYGLVDFVGPRGERRTAVAIAEGSSPPQADRLMRLTLTKHGGSPPGTPLSPTDAPLPGSLVRGTFENRKLWIDVADVEASTDGGTTLVGTPFQVGAAAPSPPPVQAEDALAQKLTLTLLVQGATTAVELGGLGFSSEHPRFIGKLPDDDELYGDPGSPPAPGSLAAAAAQPRFPLAAPGNGPAGYLPIGASILPAGPLPAIRPPGSARLRDGLPRFDPRVFVDSALAETNFRVLMDEADWIRYRSPSPRELRGAHALLGIEEVTIVVVPDAVQPGWCEDDPPHDVAYGPSAPELTLRGDEETGVYALTWTPSDLPGTTYEVWEGHGAAFANAKKIWTCLPDELELTLPDRPPGASSCYRVRGVAGTTPGAWSNVVCMPEAKGWFLDCTAHVPAAPMLDKEESGSGITTLVWSPTDVADASYELQEDISAAFEGAETISRGPDRELSLYGRPAGATLYYRVRAVAGGTAGPWSATLVVETAPYSRWFVPPPSAYPVQSLIKLQLALMQMCGARGDQFAVLALPEHYREREAAAHARALRAAGTTPGGEPNPVFSFGALYHPWLNSSDPATPTVFRRTPPDGAAAGVMAARSSERGAWIAPANEPLRDVVALDPEIGRDAYQLLQDAQVNLVRQEPGGFLWLAADTLSDDETLRPIGVRRLLQVLRRAALLHGNTYAFEPNSDVFRRTVRRAFEGLLTRMFELGAFAGATPAESFRVETGLPPNTPQSVDQGRLIVELQVAPSRPLAFLTVRLLRTGAGALQVETR
jgi:hypothetical protein